MRDFSASLLHRFTVSPFLRFITLSLHVPCPVSFVADEKIGSVAPCGRRSFKRINAVGASPDATFVILTASPLANLYSPFAAVFGSAGASPSHFTPSFVPFRPLSHAPRSVLIGRANLLVSPKLRYYSPPLLLRLTVSPFLPFPLSHSRSVSPKHCVLPTHRARTGKQ